MTRRLTFQIAALWGPWFGSKAILAIDESRGIVCSYGSDPYRGGHSRMRCSGGAGDAHRTGQRPAL